MPFLNAVIDLSHHNTLTSLQPAKDSGILGVIHKATQGTTYVDPTYEQRRALAQAAGLLWGAYHFGEAGNVDQQVAHFLDVAKPGPTDLLVLDFETNTTGDTMSVAEAADFVGQVFTRTGSYPTLYSGYAFFKAKLAAAATTPLVNCRLWIARYGDNEPTLPAPFNTYALWQYTDGSIGPDPHTVPGIGACDRDTFNGDELTLRTFWGAQNA